MKRVMKKDGEGNEVFTKDVEVCSQKALNRRSKQRRERFESSENGYEVLIFYL
jgi:hypothetical protein